MVDRLADRISTRAFLYDDPASFRAGVRASQGALREALLGRTPVVLESEVLPEQAAGEQVRRYAVSDAGDLVHSLEQF